MFNNMLQDRRGISTIITVIILVGLVLVVVGIVWGLVIGIIGEQTEEIDLTQKCLGINFDINTLTCDAVGCIVSVERTTGSKGDSFDGVQVSINNATDSGEEDFPGNIIAKKAIIFTSISSSATDAGVRVYFNDKEGNPKYCSQIASWPN